MKFPILREQYSVFYRVNMKTSMLKFCEKTAPLASYTVIPESRKRHALHGVQDKHTSSHSTATVFQQPSLHCINTSKHGKPLTALYNHPYQDGPSDCACPPINERTDPRSTIHNRLIFPFLALVNILPPKSSQLLVTSHDPQAESKTQAKVSASTEYQLPPPHTIFPANTPQHNRPALKSTSQIEF